jgi:hypothetical protein
MKNNSLTQLGGTCSILVGISYIIIGITYALDPSQRVATIQEFWRSLANNSIPNVVLHWELALSGVFALAVVPAISSLVISANEGWVRWTSSLAYFGFGVSALENFRSITLIPIWAKAYVNNDAAYQTAIIATSKLTSYDPDAWLTSGGVGLWILVVSLLAFRKSIFSKTLALVGIAVAILHWLVVIGTFFDLYFLVLFSAILGGLILIPIWYISMGRILKRVTFSN